MDIQKLNQTLADIEVALLRKGVDEIRDIVTRASDEDYDVENYETELDEAFEGDSDVYFSQQVAPLITKAAMTKKLKPLNLKPRGKGSLDRKRHQVSLIIDRMTGRSLPLQIFLNGSHYTKGDGDWDISMKHLKGWTDNEVGSFSGDPKKDASAIIQGIYDMMERTLDHEQRN